MVSLAFFFEPAVPPREDDTGLTRARPRRTAAVTEAELARDIVEQVAAIVDVDEKMSADNDLRVKMFNKSAALLGSLRYGLDAYRKFALTE